MKILKFIILILLFSNIAYAQKINTFQCVNVPDSIYLKLEQAYNKNSVNTNAGRNVFNLENRKDFTFKDGIYSFKGQGSHFPRRIFIFNKNRLFIFENEGAFNPKGVLREFIESFDQLGLTNKQIIKYSKIISNYLDEESGNNYGSKIK